MTFHEVNAELKIIRDELSHYVPDARTIELMYKRIKLEEEFAQDYVYMEDSLCVSCSNCDMCMLAERHPTRTVLECKYYE